MNKKKFWKYLRYLMALLLTLPNVFILGFLTFEGILGFIPILAIAGAVYALHVMMDGVEVFRNIKQFFSKMMAFDFIERSVTQEWLLENDHFTSLLEQDDCPDFFHAMDDQLKKMHQGKKRAERKRLKEMFRVLARLACNRDESIISEKDKKHRQLLLWLEQNNIRDRLRLKMKERIKQTVVVGIISIISALFMMPGLFYLLAESVAALPFMVSFMATPGGMLPLVSAAAVLVFMASVTYGMLLHIAIMDMVKNDTLRKWGQKLWDEGLTVRGIFLGIASGVLVILAVFLSICTAGTWWNIAKNAKPLGAFMTGTGKTIFFVFMGIIHLAFVFIQSLVGNLQSASDTYEVLENLTEFQEKPQSWREIFRTHKIEFQNRLAHWETSENAFQKWNIFRILLKPIKFPLHLCLFIAHFSSSAMSDEKTPFIPGFIAFILQFINEGFDHGHHLLKEEDISKGSSQDMLDNYLNGRGKTRDLIGIVLCVLDIPCILWDWMFSQLNSSSARDNAPKRLGFMEAFAKHTGYSMKFEEESEEEVYDSWLDTEPLLEEEEDKACASVMACETTTTTTLEKENERMLSNSGSFGRRRNSIFSSAEICPSHDLRGFSPV